MFNSIGNFMSIHFGIGRYRSFFIVDGSGLYARLPFVGECSIAPGMGFTGDRWKDVRDL